MSLFLSRLNQKFKTKYKVLDELLLFCSAFFLRAFYVSRNHYLTGDSHDYLTLAKNLAFHHVFSLDRSESALAPTAFRPPLYPVLISLFWQHEEVPLTAVLYLQAMLGALTVVIA